MMSILLRWAASLKSHARAEIVINLFTSVHEVASSLVSSRASIPVMDMNKIAPSTNTNRIQRNAA